MKTPPPPLCGFLWVGRDLKTPNLETLNRDHVSPSTMNSVLQCPAAWAVNRTLPRTTDPTTPAVTGTHIHAIYEALYQLPPSERTQETAQRLLTDLSETLYPNRPDQRQHWVQSVTPKMLGLWQIENPQETNILATELRLGPPGPPVRIDGIPIVGIIDRLRQTPTGIWVEDYKTGKLTSPSTATKWGPDKEAHQIRLYTLALTQTGQPTPQNGRLLYTSAGKTRTITLTPEELDATRRRLHQAHTLLQQCSQTRTYPTNVSALCGWCPLIGSCPAARSAGKTPAPSAPQPQPPLPVANPTPRGGGGNRPTWHITKTDRKDTPMAQYTTREAKPYQSTGIDEQGNLDPNSYTAQGLFGIVNATREYIAEHGIPARQDTATHLARTFATIVLDIQEEISGIKDFSRGLNTRIRGAFFTILRTTPPPASFTITNLDNWVNDLKRRTRNTSTLVLDLADQNWEDTPWHNLAEEGTDQ